MEKPYNGGHWSRVLEIGGGSGEHLDFIKHSYDSYILTDIRMPVLPLKWSENLKISTKTANAEELPFLNESFDRIIVTCLLHHAERPEKVMEEVVRSMTIHRAASKAG
jgi:phosphatidylethanolamine/phosphatidyl-N-methylethanolamine N-methyltransferase